MTENSMQKVRRADAFTKDSAYKSSAPVNYRTPAPVKVPPAPASKGK